MASPVSVSAVMFGRWNVLAGVSVVQEFQWNVGKPGVQQNIAQAASVPWFSTYPS